MITVENLKKMIYYYIQYKTVVDRELDKKDITKLTPVVLEWKENLDKIENILLKEKIRIPTIDYDWKIRSVLSGNNNDMPCLREFIIGNGKSLVKCRMEDEDFELYEMRRGCKFISILDCLKCSWKNSSYKEIIINALIDMVYMFNAQYKRECKKEQKSLIKTMINWEKELESLKKELIVVDKKLKELKDVGDGFVDVRINEIVNSLIKQKNMLNNYISSATKSIDMLKANKNIVSYQISKKNGKVGKSKELFNLEL